MAIPQRPSRVLTPIDWAYMLRVVVVVIAVAYFLAALSYAFLHGGLVVSHHTYA